MLIHGLGGSAEWWRHNFDVLASEHTVAAVDLIGFGRHRFFLRRPSLPPRFEEMASLLARWIESAFDEPVHLVGNSMGGHIAIHLAARRPDLIRSLVLVDSTGLPFAFDPRAHVEKIATTPGLLSFALILARDLFRAGPMSLTVALAGVLRDDARPLLRTLRMPTLLIWGEHDPFVPPRYARQLQETIAGSRLVVLPKAGHVPMWENPAAFNETLLAFLREAEAMPHDPEARGAFGWGVAGWTEGIAHRQAGHRRDVVLVHGLGMSSAYFDRFARALYERGLDPIAPDLPGFGESVNAPPADPVTHARQLAAWAERIGIRDALWLGHSTGCDAVSELAASRRDLVRDVVYLSPVWASAARLVFGLLADGFREPLALFPYVLREYWRTGLWRWLATFRRHIAKARQPAFAPSIAGERDPLVRPDAAVVWVPGAHAMHFSHPEATADAVLSLTSSTRAATPRGSNPTESSPA